MSSVIEKLSFYFYVILINLNLKFNNHLWLAATVFIPDVKLLDPKRHTL